MLSCAIGEMTLNSPWRALWYPPPPFFSLSPPSNYLKIQRILGTKGDLAVENEALLVEHQVDAKEFAPNLVRRFEGRPFTIAPSVHIYLFILLYLTKLLA